MAKVSSCSGQSEMGTLENKKSGKCTLLQFRIKVCYRTESVASQRSYVIFFECGNLAMDCTCVIQYMPKVISNIKKWSES